MTNEQLIVAQAEAFTILRDLMHIKPDDPRPQRIINTIKQAALAILRLKPLTHSAGEDGRERRPTAGEGKSSDTRDDESTRQRGSTHEISDTPRPANAGPAAAVDSLPDAQFDELITRLPHNTLYPRTDKQRDRLARHFAAYHLDCTDDVKTAIVNRASRRSSHSGTAPQDLPHAAPRRAA